MATFRVNKVFQLTDKGQVLAGDIIDGEISPGDLIRESSNKCLIELKIKSVEYVDQLNGYAETGLLTECLSIEQINLETLVGEILVINTT